MRASPERMRRRLLLALIAALASIASPAGQSGDPAVVFLSPEDGSYVSGQTVIRIRLEPPGTAVQGVSFSADGRLVCAVERPPYECSWDAGAGVVEHAVRASVLLADGRRIARTIRTKALVLNETVDVDVVQLTATVTDRDGRFVSNLAKDAFRIYEDDVPLPISTFISENVPLEITVAIDISGSMKPSIPQVKQAVKKFLSALRPTDAVTLMGFNDSPFTLSRPSADLATRLGAIDRLAAWGGTALYDVVLRAIQQLGRQTGRRALVVFTDGEDLNSRVPLETAERQLESTDAVLYAIGLGRAPGMAPLRRVLERLAKKSGGRAIFEDLDQLDEVFEGIVSELSGQYLLGYVRPDAARDGRWRRLRVEVPGRGLKVRAREGYRVEK